MKIGFLLLRSTYLKTMGSLIEASIKRGHQVTLLFTEEKSLDSKAYQRITEGTLAPLLALGAEAAPFQLDELGLIKEKFQLDILVTHEGYYSLHSYLEKIQQARNKSVKIVSLAHFYETAKWPLESLDYFDKTYYLSQFAVDTHFRLNDNPSRQPIDNKYEGKYEAHGSPMLDQLIRVDRNEISKKLGIPMSKRVILFFAPSIVPETRWRYLWWRECSKIMRFLSLLKQRQWKTLFWDGLFIPSLGQITEELRRFCDRNGAFLIVKSRAKQLDAKCLKENADLYLSGEEESYFPVFTSYELLSIADLCISVMSMSAIEAVAARVPVWNIYVPSTELDYPASPLHPHQERYYEAIMRLGQEGPFDNPACITNIDPYEVIDWFRTKNLDNLKLDPEAAKAYAEKYLGVTKETSSARILDSLEKLHAQTKAAERPL